MPPSPAMRRLALAALSLASCAPPPPSPPSPARAVRPAPLPSASASPAASTAPAAPIVEPPVVLGAPRPVVQRGLERFAAVMRVSRSGALAAVVDESAAIRLFDPRTAEERAALRGHVGRVNDVDIAPSGDRLVSAGADDTARLWDLTSDAPPRSFFSGSLVYHARFSPDGKTIATVHPRSVRLWDEAGRARAELPAEGADLAFSADGRALITWERTLDSRKDIAVWDAATGALRFKLAGGNGAHREAALSPDGRLLAFSRGDRTIEIADAETGVVARSLASPELPDHLAFSPDGALLAASDKKGAVHLWSVTTWKQTGSIRARGRGRFAFSPDGRSVAAQHEEGLAIFDAQSSREIARLKGSDSWVTAFAFLPGGEAVVGGAGIHTPELFVWNARTGDRRAARRRGLIERKIAWSGDGKTLASLGDGGRSPGAREVQLWDAETGAIKATLRRPEAAPPLSSDYHRVAASHDGARAAASNMETVSLWDARTGAHLADLDRDEKFHTEHGLAFQPHGRLVATSGGKKAEVRLWDATRGTKVRVFPSGMPLAWSLAFRPDGKALAVAGPSEVAIFDPASGARLRVIPGPRGGVLEMAWSPDGKLLAIGSTAGAISLVDPSSGEQLGQLTAHDGQLRSLSISADGELLATGGEDGAAHVFRLATREKITTLPDRDDEGVSEVAFHPRARLLAAARGSVHLFCEPSGASAFLHAVSSWNNLSGLAFADDGGFHGDPASLEALRFRKGPDARAPLAPASELSATLARPRLIADFVEGCRK